MHLNKNGISKTRVLMVCLGNICRSPLAEGILKNLIWIRNIEHLIEVDSAGTSGHTAGFSPDPRSRMIAAKNGFELTHMARQITYSDFQNFDQILVMDLSNYENVLKFAVTPEDREKVNLITGYDQRFKDVRIIPDPYYGGIKDFEKVFDQLVFCCEGWMDFYFGIDEHSRMSC